ncbi:putative cytokinetic ring protein SteA [Corynebacterium mayonis]|uniref:putative cytokinetic ring protein SteA n=1 Tax=Corynebacterium mayonis TaxID=3062461 RepID=UPI003140C6F5
MSFSPRATGEPVEPVGPTSAEALAAGDGPATVVVRSVFRDCSRAGRGSARLRAGEIAVVDSADMERREAEALIKASPGAVVNLSRFSTGAIPNYAPHMLLDAKIPLFEDHDGKLAGLMKDGKKGKITSAGEILLGKKLVGQAHPVSRRDVELSFGSAQQSLLDHMEAYFGNTIEFIHSESPLLIDGVGVPELGSSMDGRKVIIVDAVDDVRERLEGLRHFIREYEPLIVGVGAASDTVADMGYGPDFIVADPKDVSSESLRSEARVVLPAGPDGHAPGLERIQDLGVGAMTFPAATDSPLDLALLLAAVHGAEMIVTVGKPVDLSAIFANAGHASPAALLSRLKAGSRLVDSEMIESLYMVQRRNGLVWAWAILGLFVSVATVILLIGFSGSGLFADNLAAFWDAVRTQVEGWVS